jgi:hypothetical protein
MSWSNTGRFSSASGSIAIASRLPAADVVTPPSLTVISCDSCAICRTTFCGAGARLTTRTLTDVGENPSARIRSS